jgi:hypothetical protein
VIDLHIEFQMPTFSCSSASSRNRIYIYIYRVYLDIVLVYYKVTPDTTLVAWVMRYVWVAKAHFDTEQSPMTVIYSSSTK